MAERLTKIVWNDFEHVRVFPGHGPEGVRLTTSRITRMRRAPSTQQTTEHERPKQFKDFREVAERLKAHAWKVCRPKGLVGSNPILSANKQAPKGAFLLAERMGEKPSRVRQIRLERICMSRASQRRARRARYKDVPGNPPLPMTNLSTKHILRSRFFIGREDSEIPSRVRQIRPERILFVTSM